MEQVLSKEIAAGGTRGKAPSAARPYLSPKARRRQLWLQIHRWIGIILLVPMAVLGVTGSAQVWPEETEALFTGNREVAATADPAGISVEDIATARDALAEYGPVASISLGAVGEPVVVTSVAYDDPPFGIAGPVSRQAWLDPESGAVIDEADSAGGFMWYMHFIHGLFLIPGVGRQIVGIMGLFLTISGISGIVIFWPGTKRVLNALKWQKRDGAMLNIHRQSGFLLSIVLIVEAISGAWISFPAFFASIVEPGVEQPQRPRRSFGPAGEQMVMEDAAWIAALDMARQAHDGRPTAISAPMAEGGAWTVTLAGEGVEATASVPLDGSAVSVEEQPVREGPPPPSTRAGAVASWMRGVHYATIGGFIWQVLVFLSGIVMTFLAISGIWVWGRREWKRSVKRRASAAN